MEEKRKSYTFEEIKQKLVNYCIYQDRCHQEVEAKDEIMLYLINENYLNEERFARSYIRGKFYLKNWGRIKIKNHLKFKGISEKLINKCMDEIDEADYQKTIEKLYNAYFSEQKGLKNYQKAMKTVRYLISKGYEYELIREVVQE